MKKIKKINIEYELKKSYLDYAMSVIINRALPDVRDGLKPVHRRIIYSMYILKNFYNKQYKKSARIVGDVIGKYHPHGDNAVYESIVRMTQKFSIRYPLIDGQGNFGSIDGDPAAAMRYTEIKMSKISNEFIKDIKKKTVKFIYNYDSTEKIPKILPTTIPNILINGATGIAVGMTTNIPPHNITEVMNAFIKFIENKKITTKNLIKYIKGPDFPTGAIIEDNKGIYNAYKNGKGRINIIAKIKIELNKKKNKKYIIINELPYQINKSKLIEKIIELIKIKKINEINKIRDESDKDGMRIVIETKKNIKKKILINKLIHLTNLKISYNINIVALYKNKPQILNLKKIIKIFINYRKKIITNKIIFKLKKYKKKLNIIEGFLIALNNIEKILYIIKKSKNKISLIKNITKKKWKIYKKYKIINKKNKYNLTKKQTNYIIKLSLKKLTKSEQKNTYIRYKRINKKINKFKNILNNKNLIKNIIKKEFINIKNKYGDKRITKIIKKTKKIKIYDLIKKEKIIILLSKFKYIKYIKINKIKTQNIRCKGKKIIKLKENDYIKNSTITNTHSKIILFTNKGKIYPIKVFKILNNNKKNGKPIINFNKSIKENEKITFILSINKNIKKYIIIITKLGLIKKISTNKINFNRKNGINIIKLKKKDKIIESYITNGKNNIIIFTKNGKSVKFSESLIRNMNKNSFGIKSINLSNKDYVVSINKINNRKIKKKYITIITNKGYGKKTLIKEFPKKSRATKGLISIKLNKKNGNISKTITSKNKDKIIILTNTGKILKIYNKNISILKRNTQGIIIIKLNKNEKVINIINL